jgi:hypothetical protein
MSAHEDMNEVVGGREGGMGKVMSPGLAMASAHEEIGLGDISKFGGMHSGSGTSSVHEDATCEGAEETEGACLGSGRTLVHEDTSEGGEGMGGMIEGIDTGSGSDSGTAFVHKDASEVVGNMEIESRRSDRGNGVGLGLRLIVHCRGCRRVLKF